MNTRKKTSQMDVTDYVIVGIGAAIVVWSFWPVLAVIIGVSL